MIFNDSNAISNTSSSVYLKIRSRMIQLEKKRKKTPREVSHCPGHKTGLFQTPFPCGDIDSRARRSSMRSRSLGNGSAFVARGATKMGEPGSSPWVPRVSWPTLETRNSPRGKRHVRVALFKWQRVPFVSRRVVTRCIRCVSLHGNALFRAIENNRRELAFLSRLIRDVISPYMRHTNSIATLLRAIDVPSTFIRCVVL